MCTPPYDNGRCGGAPSGRKPPSAQCEAECAASAAVAGSVSSVSLVIFQHGSIAQSCNSEAPALALAPVHRLGWWARCCVFRWSLFNNAKILKPYRQVPALAFAPVLVDSCRRRIKSLRFFNSAKGDRSLTCVLFECQSSSRFFNSARGDRSTHLCAARAKSMVEMLQLNQRRQIAHLCVAEVKPFEVLQLRQRRQVAHFCVLAEVKLF